MKLIIGGAFQGKTDFAIRRFGLEPETIADAADGQASGDLRHPAAIRNYQLRIREQLRAGKDPGEELRRLILEEPEICIIADEIGSGLIPMEREDRDYREAVGRTLCTAAQEAQEVWRVTCGIGQRIK